MQGNSKILLFVMFNVISSGNYICPKTYIFAIELLEKFNVYNNGNYESFTLSIFYIWLNLSYKFLKFLNISLEE
jgi:hypothetical protein